MKGLTKKEAEEKKKNVGCLKFKVQIYLLNLTKLILSFYSKTNTNP